jgi:molybdenum cofactor cytidylyltransferase
MAEDSRSGRPDLALRAVPNPDYRHGMLASVQRGLAAASPAAEWFLIALADQPGIPAAVVSELLAAAEAAGAAIYLPTFEGRRGHPVLVHRSFQEAVAGLPAEGGLRQLWRECPGAVRHVPVDSPLILQDMDTPADYARVVREEG